MGEVLARHGAHLEYLGRRPGTVAQRLSYLRRLDAWCAPRGLLGATEADLVAYVSRAEMGPEARANAVSHFRGFFRWARRVELVDVDPSIELERPRRPRRLPRPMPEVDLRRALAAADEPIRSWLYLAAFAGLRCCEIAPLRGEDRRGNTLIVRVQKGGDEGSVPIGPTLDLALAHLPARGLWFPRWDGVDGPISPGQLQRHANRFLHDLDIAHTMHTLRHRFVTAVYQTSGRDLRVTQDLARHRSILSTVGYTWIDEADGVAAVALLA